MSSRIILPTFEREAKVANKRRELVRVAWQLGDIVSRGVLLGTIKPFMHEYRNQLMLTARLPLLMSPSDVLLVDLLSRNPIPNHANIRYMTRSILDGQQRDQEDRRLAVEADERARGEITRQEGVMVLSAAHLQGRSNPNRVPGAPYDPNTLRYRDDLTPALFEIGNDHVTLGGESLGTVEMQALKSDLTDIMAENRPAIERILAA